MELEYPNSPGMSGDNRFHKIPTIKRKKTKDDRPIDPITNTAMLQYGGEDKQQVTLRFRDGKSEVLYYSSVKEALMKSIADSDFKRAVFDGLDLSGVVCTGRDFTEATFKGANLEGAKMDNCIFNKAELSGCNMTEARCKGASFVGATMDGDTILKRTNFDYSNLENVEGLAHADTEGLSLKDVQGIDMADIEPPSDEEGEEAERVLAELEKEEASDEEAAEVHRHNEESESFTYNSIEAEEGL